MDAGTGHLVHFLQRTHTDVDKHRSLCGVRTLNRFVHAGVLCVRLEHGSEPLPRETAPAAFLRGVIRVSFHSILTCSVPFLVWPCCASSFVNALLLVTKPTGCARSHEAHLFCSPVANGAVGHLTSRPLCGGFHRGHWPCAGHMRAALKCHV